MGPLDNERTVLLIKGRMKRLGIDMDRYVGQITNKWDDVPSGFGFTCKNSAAYTSLMDELVKNLNIVSDSMLGSSQHQGASFREFGQIDSLHIILSTRPDPGLSKPSASLRATCSIHLDSVSVVKGRGPNGEAIYDTSKVLQHVATDLKRTPLIVPSGAGGIVFGFRF